MYIYIYANTYLYTYTHKYNTHTHTHTSTTSCFTPPPPPIPEATRVSSPFFPLTPRPSFPRPFPPIPISDCCRGADLPLGLAGVVCVFFNPTLPVPVAPRDDEAAATAREGGRTAASCPPPPLPPSPAPRDCARGGRPSREAGRGSLSCWANEIKFYKSQLYSNWT